MSACQDLEAQNGTVIKVHAGHGNNVTHVHTQGDAATASAAIATLASSDVEAAHAHAKEHAIPPSDGTATVATSDVAVSTPGRNKQWRLPKALCGYPWSSMAVCSASFAGAAVGAWLLFGRVYFTPMAGCVTPPKLSYLWLLVQVAVNTVGDKKRCLQETPARE